jgi:hypothetical protein
MRFHGVFLGDQHEIWSKKHNGKVSPFEQATLRDRRFIGSKAVHRVMLIFQDLEASTQSVRIRTGVNEMMTLLVKSKTRGKVILNPTFEGKKTTIMPLVKCTPMTWKFHCRDLTNRVNDDVVCRHHKSLNYLMPYKFWINGKVSLQSQKISVN